jgi:two-component system chemotaxis response regulator CheB
VTETAGVARHDAVPRHARQVVAIGGSAGAIDALLDVFAAVPADVPAAFLVVVHVGRTGPSVLPQIVGRVTDLNVAHAADGDAIYEGEVLIAPPDYHLLVHDGRVRLDHGAKEHLNRPAVNPLFRSLAAAYGENAMAVVLSGALDDGAAGAAEVKAAGGRVLVQAPADARVPSMPLSALQAVEADEVLSARALGTRVTQLAREAPLAAVSEIGFDTAEAASEHIEQEGEQSAFTCPECGGVLWLKEVGDGAVLRCRVGHSYSESSYLDGQSEAIENALWSAIRALEERADFLRRVGERLGRRGGIGGAERYARRSAELIEQGEAIRSLVKQQRLALEEPPAD